MKTLLIISLFLTTTLLLGDINWNQCAGCHGVYGEKEALGKSKILRDMPKKDIIAALNGYKESKYGGPLKGIMEAKVKFLSEKDMSDIAEKISKVKTPTS